MRKNGPFILQRAGIDPVSGEQYDASDQSFAGSGRESYTAVLKYSRRKFLRNSALFAGSAFVLGVFTGCRKEELPAVVEKALPTGTAGEAAFHPNVYIALNESGDVFVINPRSEMGQGVRSSVPPAIADEMEADLDRVHVIQADGDAQYGNQNTDGSTSMRNLFDQWRTAGATARVMLVSAAAANWGVPPEECEAENHEVHHRASGRTVGYGELASLAADQPVPEAPAFKPRAKWRYIGKEIRGTDNRDIVQGKAIYGLDVKVPGMLFASVEHCPTIAGRLVSYDATAALAVPGVRQVVEIPVAPMPTGFAPLGGLAVVADNTWAAFKGREKLVVEWDLGANAAYDSASYRAGLEASAAAPGIEARNVGDVEAAFASAATTLEAAYYVPMLAHAPMEVPNATAWVKDDGSCECWAPTQDPQTARATVAQFLDMDESNVTVHVTLLGGAFGRKSKADFVAEAAVISKAVGAPVKLTWKREDCIRFDYFHSPSAQYLKAGFDADGKAVSWLHRTAFPSIQSIFAPGVTHAMRAELNLGFLTVPYDIPNMLCENGAAEAHVRIGWMRSVSNIHHAFAVNAFAGEMAHAVGRDQLEYLFELLGPDRSLNHFFPESGPYGENLEKAPYHTGRLRGVLRRAAGEAGWGKVRLGPGEALGAAVHYSFGSYVAWVLRVAVEDGQVRVLRADGAIDCGTIVNVDRVRAQMEGNLVFGLTLTFNGDITVKNGSVEQSNFHDYPLLRINEVPETHVHLIESEMIPGGVGEPGLPPVAPALTNAILAATGKPVRELPIRLA